MAAAARARRPGRGRAGRAAHLPTAPAPARPGPLARPRVAAPPPADTRGRPWSLRPRPADRQAGWRPGGGRVAGPGRAGPGGSTGGSYVAPLRPETRIGSGAAGRGRGERGFARARAQAAPRAPPPPRAPPTARQPLPGARAAEGVGTARVRSGSPAGEDARGCSGGGRGASLRRSSEPSRGRRVVVAPPAFGRRGSGPEEGPPAPRHGVFACPCAGGLWLQGEPSGGPGLLHFGVFH